MAGLITTLLGMVLDVEFAFAPRRYACGVPCQAEAVHPHQGTLPPVAPEPQVSCFARLSGPWMRLRSPLPTSLPGALPPHHSRRGPGDSTVSTRRYYGVSPMLIGSTWETHRSIAGPTPLSHPCSWRGGGAVSRHLLWQQRDGRYRQMPHSFGLAARPGRNLPCRTKQLAA